MHIGYARVSTNQQDTALQTDALNAAGCKKLFEETASGAWKNRPALAAALNFMRDGDTLVVWKLDRLARSTRQLIETVEDMEQRGIGFQSLQENIDTTSPGGRLVFHVFAALAEFERDMIRERTKAGLESARKRGAIAGRPRAMDDGAVAMARAMMADPEISVAAIASKFGVSTATLYRNVPGGKAALTK